MAIPDKAELWASFACAALNGYEEPDKIEDEGELADDMVRVSTSYADLMLKEYEKRFNEDGEPKKRRRSRKPDEDEEDEVDDDDDDED